MTPTRWRGCGRTGWCEGWAADPSGFAAWAAVPGDALEKEVGGDSDFERQKWRGEHALELRKWRADQRWREHEIALQDRAQSTRQEEIVLKRKEMLILRWTNPLVLAIFSAEIAGFASVGVNALNNYYALKLEDKKATQTLDLERNKAETARILEMIKTGDVEHAAANLRFLADSGLIGDEVLLKKIQKFLESRKEGTGPFLQPAGQTSNRRLPTMSFPSNVPGMHIICDYVESTAGYTACQAVPDK